MTYSLIWIPRILKLGSNLIALNLTSERTKVNTETREGKKGQQDNGKQRAFQKVGQPETEAHRVETVPVFDAKDKIESERHGKQFARKAEKEQKEPP